FLRLLENGGRAAVIVPDGVLFGSSNAHVEIRKKLIEDNRLDGVVSMPSGVFKPYAGVSTAVLLFTKGGTTERIWFYDMEHDGFSLDDKRQRVPDNDIPDILACWQHRQDIKFQQKRTQRLADLQKQIAPLKKERLAHHALIHRLKFEEVVADSSAGVSPVYAVENDEVALAAESPARYRTGKSDPLAPQRGERVRVRGNAVAASVSLQQAESELAELNSRIQPLENEINQLTRQFWVTKDQVKANHYDLSASRYRQLEHDETYYEQPAVTLERLRQLEQAAEADVQALEKMLKA
ncbi:MAG: N-6 DNA methylase, partial [Verrucomicrobiia bacterium]